MKREDNWLDRYNLLVKYKKEHGNTDVPYNYKENGIKLGHWVAVQRFAYFNSCRLNPYQIKILNKLDFKWNYNEETWIEKYEQLKKYKDENGNINVHKNDIFNGVNLYSWITAQKQRYKNHELSKDQIKKLEELGIVWSINDEKWNQKYKLLEGYYQEHGNIDVPKEYEVNEIRLGTWLRTQRQAYIGKNSCKITQEQIDKLNKLGMIWSINDEKWDEKYEIVEEYYQKHGNIDIAPEYKIDGIKLGYWLQSQKQAYIGQGKCKINKKQIVKLNKLEIDWSKHDTNLLNKPISKIPNIKVYKEVLNNRVDYILRDLTLEGINQINSKKDQQAIEKELIKRIWR